MSSERLRSPFVRRWLPWGLWALAVVVAVPLGLRSSGLGVAPAMIEVRRVNLVAPRTVRLVQLTVRPGDPVKAGQLVARLDPSELDAELAVAKAELVRLELEVSSREVALKDDRAQTADRLAGEAERSALVATQLEVEDQKNRSELAQLDEQVQVQQALVAERLASAEQLNQLKLRRAALAKVVEESSATLKQAKANAAATAARLGDWKTAAPRPRDESQDLRIDRQIAPVRAAAEAQRERCRQLEQVRRRLELAAPFDGRVAEVLAVVGDTVREGLPVLTVVDAAPRSAIAYVDQRWSGRVRLGDRVSLAPSDRSGPARGGTVTALGASITEAPLRFRLVPTEPLFCREAFISLDEPAPLPGQAFNATFRRGRPAPQPGPDAGTPAPAAAPADGGRP